MMYEFCTGTLPFAQADDDPYSICHQVLTENVKCPATLPETASALLTQLLSRSPLDRGTAAELKYHAYFSDFPFVFSTQDDLYQQTLSSPFSIPAKNYSSVIAAARRNPATWRSVMDENLQREDMEGDLLPFRTEKSSLSWNWDDEF